MLTDAAAALLCRSDPSTARAVRNAGITYHMYTVDVGLRERAPRPKDHIATLCLSCAVQYLGVYLNVQRGLTRGCCVLYYSMDAYDQVYLSMGGWRDVGRTSHSVTLRGRQD